MIPVRSLNNDRSPGLASLVISELETIERGLDVVATSVPLPDGTIVDALAEDTAGQVVLVLVEEDSAAPLFERAARAILGYRRIAPLLARLHPDGVFESGQAPRLVLVARRFAESVQDLVALLRVPGLRWLECAGLTGTAGRQLAILSQGPPAAGDEEPLPPVTGSAPVNGSAQPSRSPAPRMRRTGPNGGMANGRLFDVMKQRLLRLSPDVIQEDDGDLVRFRVAGHLLAAIRRQGKGVHVTPGDDCCDVLLVEDEPGLNVAMDAVFDRFFGIAPTRKRVAAADSRTDREKHGRNRGGLVNTGLPRVDGTGG